MGSNHLARCSHFCPDLGMGPSHLKVKWQDWDYPQNCFDEGRTPLTSFHRICTMNSGKKL